jgi:excisionase family DNA binding protein
MAHDTRETPPPRLRDEVVLTIEEVADLLRLGRTTTYEAVRRGEIPARRLGHRILVPVPALLEWLQGYDRLT